MQLSCQMNIHYNKWLTIHTVLLKFSFLIILNTCKLIYFEIIYFMPLKTNSHILKDIFLRYELGTSREF